WALLAAGRADLPARRDRGGAPHQRGRSRAGEARAAGRLMRASCRPAAACQHLIFYEPRSSTIGGRLTPPQEAVRRYVAKTPALFRVLVEPVQNDYPALASADESPYPAVERIAPGRPPGTDVRVIETDSRSMKRTHVAAIARIQRHAPDVLNRGSAENPAKVQLARDDDRRAPQISAMPLQVPRTN